jgi:hypothetical protein
LDFLQNILWRNAGLTRYRNLQALDNYIARYDPTVIPIIDNPSSKSVALPAPTKHRNGDNSGYYTSADYRQRYLSGELTPSAVVEALLPLIQRDIKPPGKHSIGFLESRVEAVRAAAAASTERYANGKPLGPLDGVPVAVKDEVHLKGYKRTLGSKLDFKGGIDATSWCVQKWEEAGAIVVGKTNMHELGIGRALIFLPRCQFSYLEMYCIMILTLRVTV